MSTSVLPVVDGSGESSMTALTWERVGTGAPGRIPSAPPALLRDTRGGGRKAWRHATDTHTRISMWGKGDGHNQYDREYPTDCCAPGSRGRRHRAEALAADRPRTVDLPVYP